MNFAPGISVYKFGWSEISGPQSAIKSAISPPVRHHPHLIPIAPSFWNIDFS
jgi:hypothetical protein